MGNCIPLALIASASVTPLPSSSRSRPPDQDGSMSLRNRSMNGPQIPFKRRRYAPMASDCLLGTPTEDLRQFYDLGKELGRGQFGVIRQCTNKTTGESFACKSISKLKLPRLQDVEDVRREIDIMRKLSGHPNVVGLKDVYEDEGYVHLVMELCEGGELFDRIVKKQFYPESEAAPIFKTLVEVVKYCHEMGVIHRDLKPENILLATTSPSSPIKLADFGLALNFTPGDKFRGKAGSAYYIAPEILNGRYSEEVDVWSAGVILYILLSGVPPFWAETEQGIFEAIQDGEIDFASDPWGQISASAKDLISRMLCPNPKARITPAEILRHPWILRHTAESEQEDKRRTRQESSENAIPCKTESREDVAGANLHSTEALEEVSLIHKDTCLSEAISFKCPSLAATTTNRSSPPCLPDMTEFAFQKGAELSPAALLYPAEAAFSSAFSFLPAETTDLGFYPPLSTPQGPSHTSVLPVASFNALLSSSVIVLTDSPCERDAESTSYSPLLTESASAACSPSSSFSSDSASLDSFDRWASFSQVAEPTFSEFLATAVCSLNTAHLPVHEERAQKQRHLAECSCIILNACRDKETVVVDSSQGKFLVVHDRSRRRIGWKCLDEQDCKAPDSIETKAFNLNCWAPSIVFS